MRNIPEDIEDALAGLQEADFDLARAEGAWTIREIAHHLVDAYDTTWQAIEAAIGQPGCRYYLDWYDPANTWTTIMRYRDRPVGPALAFLRAKHAYLAPVLDLVPDAGSRFFMLIRSTGDPERRLTVNDLVQHLNAHAQQHIAQIRTTRKIHGR